MRKIIILVLAGTLVLGVGLIATAQAEEAQTEKSSDDDAESEKRGRHKRGSRFEQALAVADVLAGLVSDGTLTQAQMDAVVAAVEEARARFVAEHRDVRAMWESFWEDRVLTADEIAQLPFAEELNDPDGPFAPVLEDGQITEGEFEQLEERFDKGTRGRHRGRVKNGSRLFGDSRGYEANV